MQQSRSPTFGGLDVIALSFFALTFLTRQNPACHRG
jgi:hypothetical protein